MTRLEADGLKKSYRGRMVVKGVHVEITPGEVVGLLGPNGAGNDDFYMITGLVRQDEGTVR